MRRRNLVRFRNSAGFTEFEFVLLVASALLIAALLAHFVFDQNVQVQKLNALVARDQIRLALESRLVNIEVIKKSVEALPKEGMHANLRACILGEKNCPSLKGHCCQSRSRKSMPILDFGDTRKVIGGTIDEPSCLNEAGEASTVGTCFATSRVSIDPICAEGRETCKSATALIILYQIQFESPFLKDNPEISTVDRSVSVLLDTSGPYSSP